MLAYGAPALGHGFMLMLLVIYFVKFATDVLLVAPATVGAIFGLSRVWDAVSDPLAGYWSDRTRSRMGRRRPWLLAACLPTALFYTMAWSPPESFAGPALVAWLAAAVLGFFTATTIFAVPHASLGAELSTRYHERTRIFAVRHVCWILGFFCVPLGLYLIGDAEEPRVVARRLALGVAGATALLMLVPVVWLRERPEYQGRGAQSSYRALGDVWRNPHARILLLVFFIENLGTGAMGVLAPFVIEYVMGVPDLLPWFFPLYFVPAALSIPLWLRLAHRFEKRNLWVGAMSMNVVAYTGFFFAAPERIPLLCACGVLAGLAGGCGPMMAPSIQADVVDWDELHTGERKEGTYYAAWSFVLKSAGGIMAMLARFALQLSGFEPNAPQSDSVKLAMRALFGLLPAVAYALGAALFLRFRLTRTEHARIRASLDARARAGRGSLG